MGKVLGLGGVFFKSADPAASNDWYRRVLGVTIEDWCGAQFTHPSVGYTVLSPFKANTDYFAPSGQPFMINLLVDDLDAVLERARSEGVEPLGQEGDETNGRFAWLLDPDGVKLELWEPAAAQ